ncbi:MAG TPA: voltage-gated sodium channel [Rhodobacteraceae bacterium]|jgi:voltage-gated sodium channel|nr:voltage-gated sodium channel [Paracoccaceae bacterium]
MRSTVAAFTEHKAFGYFILGVIIFNSIILGMETSDGLMARFGPALIFFDKLCLTIFVAEIVLKLIAQDIRFFKNGWNLFDFTIVAIALLPDSGALSVLRTMRILRVLRLISIVPSLRRVVEGFITALPGMISVFGLMAIIFYIAGVMATKLYSDTFPQWFGSIGASFYSLFQIMTLESWSMGIVRPVMEIHPYAWAFFVPFIMVTTFAVVNLVIGLIVTSMEGAHDAEDAKATDGYRDEVLAKLDAISARLEAIEQDKTNQS